MEMRAESQLNDSTFFIIKNQAMNGDALANDSEHESAEFRLFSVCLLPYFVLWFRLEDLSIDEESVHRKDRGKSRKELHS
jgi:hypothetical protein